MNEITKYCHRCEKSSVFRPVRYLKDGTPRYRGHCEECRNAVTRANRQENKERDDEPDYWYLRGSVNLNKVFQIVKRMDMEMIDGDR